MTIRPAWLGIGFCILVLLCAAAPISRPRVRHDIPLRNYQHRGFSETKRVLSKTYVFMQPQVTDREAASSSRNNVHIKAFQFVESPRILIDHCEISNMTVLVEESGRFTVTMRATQNAPLAERRITTSEPATAYTANRLRDRFHVTVRCYAGHGAAGADTLIGKPIVVPITLEPFWVQRGQPDTQYQVGEDLRLQRFFRLIDRVELEFKYEKR